MPLKPSKKESFNINTQTQIRIWTWRWYKGWTCMAMLPAIYLGINAGMWHGDNFMMALQCPVATPRKELLQDSKVQVPRKSWSKVSDEFVAMIPRGHGRDMLGFEMAHIHCHNFCCCFKCFTLLRFLSVVVCLLFGFGFVAVVVLFVASLTFIFLAYLSLSHPVAGRAIRVTLVRTIKSTIRQITRFSGWLPVWPCLTINF